MENELKRGIKDNNKVFWIGYMGGLNCRWEGKIVWGVGLCRLEFYFGKIELEKLVKYLRGEIR